MAGGNEFPVLARKGAVVDREGHGKHRGIGAQGHGRAADAFAVQPQLRRGRRAAHPVPEIELIGRAPRTGKARIDLPEPYRVPRIRAAREHDQQHEQRRESQFSSHFRILL